MLLSTQGLSLPILMRFSDDLTKRIEWNKSQIKHLLRNPHQRSLGAKTEDEIRLGNYRKAIEQYTDKLKDVDTRIAELQIEEQNNDI